MKPRKNTMLIMLLGLLLVAFSAGTAQTSSQGDQTRKTEACCAMDSCCCSGDSCQTMKADGTSMAADATAKRDGKHSCCSGDSCKMKTKDGNKNHAGDDHACCDCCGDSCENDCCNARQKTKTKKAA